MLVTSSLVAVRGLARSLHDHFGFHVQNTMLAETDLSMGGYSGDRVAAMQKRMVDAVETIAGVESVGLADTIPLGDSAPHSLVFADGTPDLRPSHSTADALSFNISPEHFPAARTALLSGRTFTLHDDKNLPRVATLIPEARPAGGRRLGGRGGGRRIVRRRGPR